MADGTPYRPGSKQDFDRLYRQSYPRLLRTVYGVLGDAAAAEDCVQEAFLRAYRAWPRFKPDRPAEAWLHQIALNVAISQRRRLRLREVGELIRRLGRPGNGTDPADAAAGSELVAAISSLPPKLSSAFVLRHYHGYSNREIARIQRVSERSVGERLAQARERLAACLGPDWGLQVPTPGPSRVSFASVDAWEGGDV
jgi:RNA polymerase sigma-70 factor (ECF subfamily)